MISPLKKKLINNEISVIIADTVNSQLTRLNDILSHVNTGQFPFDMGYMAILTLYNIASHKAFQETTYTPLTYCTPENHSTCTK